MKKTLREIDALIATEIMGWRLVLNSSGEQVGVCCPPYWFPVSPPKYSSDISAAWEVVEKMALIGFEDFNLDTSYVPGGWKWTCYFFDSLGKDAESRRRDTAPLAICIAALKTKGIEVEVGEA